MEAEKQQRKLRHEKFDPKDFFNETCTFAKETVKIYDILIHDQYEAQVWQHFYDLGRKKNHLAKEIVDITHTRDTNRNMKICEEKISQFTETCLEANRSITRQKRDCFSSLDTEIATNAEKRAHDIMLDYIKDATKGLTKMSINRMRRASSEKDEWEALQAFEKVASEKQKMYAKIDCKPTVKNYNKKKKNFDLLATQIKHDMIPNILPKYDFHLPVDNTSLTNEQVQIHRESILKLSKDFRLKAAELYLGIAKQEFEFQERRLNELLADFPPNMIIAPLTQEVAAT